jgi:hypothetical protein
MTEVRYTLVSEGTSDVSLGRILDWLFREHLPDVEPTGVRAEFPFRTPKPRGLQDRVRAALEDFPCDVLFIHRDADAADGLDDRREEIRRACAEVSELAGHPHLSVVPVQESEAWFLIDESAIRLAAGNRAGKVALNLPALRAVERLARPKERLTEALVRASELTGRRRDRFNAGAAKRRLSESIEDFSPLRRLPAFQRLEADVIAFCETVAADE